MAGPWVSRRMPVTMPSSEEILTNILDHGAHPIVGRVAHIEAEDIGSRHDQGAELFG